MIRRFLSLLAVLALAATPALADPLKPLVVKGGQTRQLPAGDTVQTNASTTGAASINMPHGVAPTSPVNGDCWTTTAGLFCRINGNTVGPLVALNSIPRNVVPATATPGVDPTGSTDSTSGLTTAISGAISGGYELYIPCGTYLVTNLSISGAPSIRGAGQNCTTIKGTVAANDTITIAANASPYISDLTVDKSVTATGGYGIRSTDLAYPNLVNITVRNNYGGFFLGATARAYCTYCSAISNYSDGFYFQDTAAFVATQWQLLNPLSELNNGWGYRTFLNSTTGLDTGQTFIAAGSYANTLGGFLFDGVSTSAMNDLIMVNSYSSSDGQNGFKFVRTGRFNQISDSFSELVGRTGTGRGQATAASNTGCGYSFNGTGLSNSSITMNGIVATGNSYAGVCVETNSGVKSFTMTNIRMVGNGASGSNNAGMILLDTSPRFIVSGAFISDDGFGTQANGIYFDNSTVAGNMIMSAAYVAGTTTGCNTAITNKAAVVGTGC